MMDANEFEIQRATAYETARQRREMHESGHDLRYHADRAWLGELWKWTVPAEREDYDLWLSGYLRSGGKVTHFYDYDMPVDQWFVANVHFQLRPLYGALSINVIVRPDVAIAGATGHSSLYLMDGFATRGFHGMPASVPAYANNRFVDGAS